MAFILLSPDIEARLREKAEREGQDITAIVNFLLAATLDAVSQERKETSDGIKRGLADFSAGRYTSASKVFTSLRQFCPNNLTHD